ncbi:MAG: 16S rRNA (cytidine(1402)-2'-O)-methyltransferase [Patescibacteria group bacterium]|nr:16S rRNA (cytidine(1402)-2'-O)-methyltransferase [Patescibacteria group bacterium]MDE1966900.1 16S rRNA (cytidine(1402)-2'-O)-methyltransferase [Patescibacteria group bacterium]
MSKLSIVGTPIGNLGDLTIRALDALKSADIVLCEDTRVTKKLLSHYGLEKPTLSYHSHSKLSRSDEIIGLIREGKELALVSDAGTPGISDPGAELVSRVREALSAEIDSGVVKIEAIPGPSALVVALSIAGVPCADFTFLGFLPHKKGRETLFKEIASSERTMVFYESPHRILRSLLSLADHLGPGSKKAVTVCRELTKIYEEVKSGPAESVLEFFEAHPDKVRGEFVVIVS